MTEVHKVKAKGHLRTTDDASLTEAIPNAIATMLAGEVGTVRAICRVSAVNYALPDDAYYWELNALYTFNALGGNVFNLLDETIVTHYAPSPIEPIAFSDDNNEITLAYGGAPGKDYRWEYEVEMTASI